MELNVALAVKYSHPVDFSVVGAENKNGNLSLSFQSIANETILASARVPVEAFKNKSQIVYSFLFRNDILFQTGKQLKALDTGAPLSSSLSSKVLAVSVGKEKIENLTSPVIFTFIKNKNISPKVTQIGENICTFWDPNIRKFTLDKHFATFRNFGILYIYINTVTSFLATPFSNVFGNWLRRGCIKLSENDDEVQCECDHLTNFALLFDVSQSQANPLELQIITWIGCGIFLAGLFLTLLSYGIFR